MAKYRKKPIVIEAIKVQNSCSEDITKFFGKEQEEKYGYIDNNDKFEIWINTLEGIMTASYGDYIIKGIQGEFYPCKPDVFEKTYELVEQ